MSDGPPIFDAPRTFPESNASHIAGDGNIDWTATVGRAHLESPRPLTRVAVTSNAALSSLRHAPTRVLVLTQKAVLYLFVDSVQPLFRALGLLLISRRLRL